MSSGSAFLQRLAIRRLVSHPVRSFICVGVIAAGVALFISVRSVGRASLGTFTRNLQAISGDVAFVVTAGELGFRESLIENIEGVEGVERVNAIVESHAFVEGRARPVPVVGVDLLQDGGRRRMEAESESLIEDPLTVVAMPDSVLVPRPLAEELKLDLDASLSIRTVRGGRKLTVRGIFWDEMAARAYGGAFLLMDIDAARLHFGKRGKTDRLDVIAEDDADLDALESRLREKAGPGISLERPERGQGVNERAVGTLRLVLSLQSLLALLAGGFLVFNLMSIAAAERRRETGLLRAVGASRGSVATVFLFEVLPLGIVGAVLGILLGRSLAGFMVETVGSGLVGTVVQTAEVVAGPIPPADSATAFALGLLTTVLGGILPALRAARVPPVEAVSRDPVSTDSSRGLFRYSGRIGFSLISLAVIAAIASKIAHVNILDSAAHATSIVGFLLWIPSLVSLMASGVRSLYRGSDVVFRLAIEQMLRNPRRTGTASAALVIGIVLVVTVGAVGRSFERSATDWYVRIFRDDLLVTGQGELAGYRLTPMHESLISRFSSLPGVELAHALRFVRTQHLGQPIVIKAYDRAGEGAKGHGHLLFVKGEPDRALEELFDPASPAVFVSENFARTFGKSLGDRLELSTPFGPRAFRIAAVLTDYASPVGVVAMARPAYRKIFADPFVTVVGIRMREGAEASRVREAVLALESGAGPLRAYSQREIRDEIRRVFRDGLAYTKAIELVALSIAFLALLSHFVMSVSGRVREIGVLRAVGATRGQVTGMILWEALIQGVIAGSAALALSAGFAAIWVKLTLSRTWGWELDFHFPWVLALVAFAGAVCIPAAAAGVAARRVSRLEVRDALAFE